LSIESPVSLAGNILALLAVGSKTLYDLRLNPSRFNRELEELKDLEAAKRKRSRADSSSALTFLALTISYCLLILDSFL
jgi:hypothetical protein